MSTYSGTLAAPDGSSVAVTLGIMPPASPAPAPTLDPTLAAATAATVGASSFPLAGVQHGTAPAFPGGRGTNELVLYAYPLGATPTNQFGVEVTVDGAGVVVATNDRQTGGSGKAATPVPAAGSGYVLSGHGTARDWLLSNARQGTLVSLAAPAPAPGPTSAPAPAPAPRHPVIEEWLMQWPGYGPPVSVIPLSTNVLNLAFLQGAGIPVGWGNETQAQLVTDLAAFRAAGDAVLAGVGGSGGAVNTANRQAFIADVMAYRGQLGGNLDGLNWDIEASALNGSDVIAISQACAAQIPGWQTVLCPNGGNVDAYLPVAVQLQQLGLLTRYGQQFYDAPVSLSAVESRIQQAIDAGIPVEKITVGMMIQADSQHWTLQQCVDNMTAVRAKWATIGGAFLWEAGRAQSDAWSAAMAAILAT